MQELMLQLNQLKLAGVRDALEQQRTQANTYAELSFTERLQLLLAHELTQREQRRIERTLRLPQGLRRYLPSSASQSLGTSQRRQGNR